MKNFQLQYVIVILAGFVGGLARAGTPAWSNNFDMPVPNECQVRAWTEGFNSPYTQGWEVRFNVNARVTDLGIYDAGYAAIELPPANPTPEDYGVGVPGVAADTFVGMWDASGQLLAQAVVPAGFSAELAGNIRFVPISPVDVQAGAHLIFARWAPASDWSTQDFESFPLLANADYYYTDCWFQFSNADLTHIAAHYAASESLTFPDISDTSVPYFLVGSVNFRYETVDLIFANSFE
jgi:hypothetical protein